MVANNKEYLTKIQTVLVSPEQKLDKLVNWGYGYTLIVVPKKSSIHCSLTTPSGTPIIDKTCKSLKTATDVLFKAARLDITK